MQEYISNGRKVTVLFVIHNEFSYKKDNISIFGIKFNGFVLIDIF